MWKESVTVIRKSPKAILVEYEGVEEWIPLSVIHDDSEIYQESKVGDVGLLAIPEWLAEERGWLL